MFDRVLRLRALAIFSLVQLSSAVSALALPAQDEVSSKLGDMPHWPIYIAGLVAIVIGTVRAYGHFRGGRPKPRVFPKLALRRRLYAPYSGGNHAEIGFGRGDA